MVKSEKSNSPDLVWVALAHRLGGEQEGVLKGIVSMPDLADQSKWLGREGYLLVRHTVYSINTDHVCGIERKFRSGREAGCGWSRTS